MYEILCDDNKSHLVSVMQCYLRHVRTNMYYHVDLMKRLEPDIVTLIIVSAHTYVNDTDCNAEQWQGVAVSVSPTHISHCHLYWYHLFLIKTRHTTGLHVHTCTTCLHNSWPTDPASLIETICYLHHAQIMKKYSIPW